MDPRFRNWQEIGNRPETRRRFEECVPTNSVSTPSTTPEEMVRENWTELTFVTIPPKAN